MKKLLLVGLFVLLMICVTPVAALTAVDDSYEYMFGSCHAQTDESEGYVLLGNILENDDYSPSVTIEITQKPDHGIIEIQSDGSLAYIGPVTWNEIIEGSGGYIGPASFHYRLYDSIKNEYSNEATVHIEIVNGFYGGKIVTNYNIPKDTQLDLDEPCFSGEPMFMTYCMLTSYPTHGSVNSFPSPDEEDLWKSYYRYMPNTGFNGKDQFKYSQLWDSMDWECVTENTVNINVGENPTPTPTPEFPSTILPVTMIIGFLGAVLLIQRTREH